MLIQRVEMPVSSATDPSVVAGALAARVREGVEVALSAIGVDAVGNAMRAICFARLYLEVGVCYLNCGPGLHGVVLQFSECTSRPSTSHLLNFGASCRVITWISRPCQSLYM